MILSDLHIHSNNSFDAKNSVDEMCKSALNNGLYAVAVTDHCEAPFIEYGTDCEYGDFDKLIPKSLSETRDAQIKYKGKIKILCGIELGEPMHDLSATNHVLKYGDFDFILASVHNLRNMEDFYFLDYNKIDIPLILNNYFCEIAETANFPYFDSLAHLTYPFRYIFESTHKIPSLESYSKQIDNILKILIKNKKALEINVSGLFKPMNCTLPDIDIIKRFKELGGEYITVGTDSHTKESVGQGIEQGLKIAVQAGFKQYTIFEKHKPILIDIV